MVWWERLTRCYWPYTEPRDFSFKQNPAAFKALFTLAMGMTFSLSMLSLAPCLKVREKTFWV